MEKKELVVIPWSGGFDSTFLLAEELLNGSLVVPVYFKYKNIGTHKIQAENLSRKIIRLFLESNAVIKERGGRLYDEEVIELGVFHNASSNIHCPQTNYFVPILSNVVRSKHFRELAGDRRIIVKYPFVMNDDAISFLPEIKKLFNAVSVFETGDKTDVEISFPLSRTSKPEMFSRMYAFGSDIDCLKLFSYTHTCEMPVVKTKYPFIRIKSCGECKPCLTHKLNFGPIESGRRFDPGRTFLLNNGNTTHGTNPKITRMSLLNSRDHPKAIKRADEVFDSINKTFEEKVRSWIDDECTLSDSEKGS